jgi:hypothetical protein
MRPLLRVSLRAAVALYPAAFAACADAPTGPGLNPDVAADTADTAETVPEEVPPPPECTSVVDCEDKAGRPLCNLATGECEALPRGYLIGTGDGTPSSVELVELYRPTRPIESTDLEFHPERDELWVLNRRFEVNGLCNQSNPNSSRCRSLGSTTTIIFAPGSANQREETLEDENSWHFMRRAPALAMGARDTFATCGEAATGNFEDDPMDYIGGSLWSADLEIYAQPSGANGSHLDMLHETPWCMGLAHQRDNVYWLFNGKFGAIDLVDFNEDHGPGADDHSDGEIWRYANGMLTRLPNVPSHMVYNPNDYQLYIVDSGARRIVKLDTNTGEPGGPLQEQFEPLKSSGMMLNAVLAVVVDDGVLVEPSGLALAGDVLYVSDHKTSRIHAYSLAGEALRTLDTGLPEGTLAGLEVHNDNLYLSDMLTGAVYRIDWR